MKNAELADALVEAIEGYEIDFEVKVIPQHWSAYHRFDPLFYSNTALLSHDHNGVLNFYNIGAQKVFEYRPEEAIGMESVELVPHHLRIERAEELERALVEPVTMRTERIVKGGRIITIDAVVFPYQLNGKPSAAAVVKRIA